MIFVPPRFDVYRAVSGQIRDIFAEHTDLIEPLSRRVLLAHPNAEGFLDAIGSVRNRYRVCGVAPIYATIRAAAPSRGSLLCYDQWDEVERESAVTFASVALWRE